MPKIAWATDQAANDARWLPLAAPALPADVPVGGGVPVHLDGGAVDRGLHPDSAPAMVGHGLARISAVLDDARRGRGAAAT